MATKGILTSNVVGVDHIKRFLKNFDELDRYQKTRWHDRGCTSLVYLSGAERQCDCWLSEARRLYGGNP